MPRYIDAEKIEIKAERGINDDGLVFIPMRDVHRSIDRTPTADVVEVVRCKDCKHGESRQPSKLGFVWCGKWGNILTARDFCSYGERREA